MLLSFLFKQKKINYLTEIKRAVRILSKKSIEMIIVIERGQPLNLIIPDQVSNLSLSAENIIELAKNKQGPIVISRDRIAATECLLPFPENIFFSQLTDSQLACLGVSQLSDAVSIVVSEGGRIALSCFNSIKTNLSIGEFDQLIDNIFDLENNIRTKKQLIVRRV